MSSATMDGGYMLTNTVTGNAAGLRTSSPGSVSPHDTNAASDAGGSGVDAASTGAPTTDTSVEGAHRSASYMLDGRDSELRNYIDHKAEITGTLEARADEAGDAHSIPTRGSKTSRGRNTGLQWLHVASVKVISSDCAAK